MQIFYSSIFKIYLVNSIQEKLLPSALLDNFDLKCDNFANVINVISQIKTARMKNITSIVMAQMKHAMQLLGAMKYYSLLESKI